MKRLQEILIEAGYLSGKADGKYQSKTVKAVKDFQVVNGLDETGKCDRAMWDLINSGRYKSEQIYYKSKNGKVYHWNKTCSGMKTAYEIKLSDAIRKGLRRCSRCW